LRSARIAPACWARTSSTPTASRGAAAQQLWFEGDLLGVSLEGRGSVDERRLLRDFARLDETLAELGENLMRSGRGDDRDRGSTTAASAPCRPNVGAGVAQSAGKGAHMR
jgi:hypothetical protein